jgi:hypothetical protein
MAQTNACEQAATSTILPRFDRPTTPTEDHWQLFRALITKLYRDEGKSLRDVLAYLSIGFNFQAT